VVYKAVTQQEALATDVKGKNWEHDQKNLNFGFAVLLRYQFDFAKILGQIFLRMRELFEHELNIVCDKIQYLGREAWNF